MPERKAVNGDRRKTMNISQGTQASVLGVAVQPAEDIHSISLAHPFKAG